MIVTEIALREIFDQLPPYQDNYKIKFEWGGQEDLILFLKNISGNKYPLIWLVESSEDADSVTKTIERKCRFILAKDSNHITNRNPIIWETEFENCLNPLLKNVITALERNGMTTIIDNYTIRRDANYTNADLKGTDFWNVIVLDIKLKFSNYCINKSIKF